MWEKKTSRAQNIKVMMIKYPIFVQQFYVLCITLLSLLIPLSFLLLARLLSANYIISLATKTPPKTFLYNLFLNTSPNLLHGLISIVSLAALINALTRKTSFLNDSFSRPKCRPRIHVAWICLCTLQVCVGLGIEATIKAGVDGAGFGDGRSMISKVVFFLGLHETMIYWSRTIVRPVVDDTIYGGPKEEKWLERWILAACFGALSWWRLRDEVDSLVVVVEVKRDMMMQAGLGDFLGLWLYYLTVAIGMSRILKCVMWFGMKFFCRRLVDDDDDDDDDQNSDVELVREDEDKV